jgi:hypothetical protein
MSLDQVLMIVLIILFLILLKGVSKMLPEISTLAHNVADNTAAVNAAVKTLSTPAPSGDPNAVVLGADDIAALDSANSQLAANNAALINATPVPKS